MAYDRVKHTYLYVPGPSFPKSSIFITANSFTKNEEPGISFQSQYPLESQLQHDMLPLPCFYRCLPPIFILILITPLTSWQTVSP